MYIYITGYFVILGAFLFILNDIFFNAGCPALALYSNLNEIGINNPFQKKQKIEDLINCYINIYSEDNYLKDSFNSSFLKKLVKQNKYNNVYGIFSTVEKEDRSFESSFIGYIDKLDASYLIFITVDISTYNNVFFYSTSVLDKMISLFDKM